MRWPIEPEVLTGLLVSLQREYAPGRILITENGAAFDDVVGPGGDVDDSNRIAYLRGHIEAAHETLRAGVPLVGYLVWSLLDNFEWSEGYERRFGLVHVDYESQRRTPKASARWYEEVVRRGGVLPG
jgi:beta-glucosidase